MVSVGAFRDEGGYTSVAVAVSLLVSISLVFCVASAEWTLSRSSDLQRVADATAMSGANVVAAYTIIAQVLDACVLSMGLVGMSVLGAGLVMAAIPGARSASAAALHTGRELLSARSRFASSAESGLRTLEGMLPYACVANSYACASANGEEGLDARGFAIPVPWQSLSVFPSDTQVQTDELMERAQMMQDLASKSEEAKRRADDARRRAWEADCVDAPSCLRSRAESLAGMQGAQNPSVSAPESWSFGMPISRSRTYYALRLAAERPKGSDIESVTDSLAREAFYAYALGEVNGAWYREGENGTVSLHVPHLARGSDEVRTTSLYTDVVWPCTWEEDGRVLHSTRDCEGAQGPDAGLAAVAHIDEGAVRLCPVCQMDVTDLGAVAAISTVATNGYEHYWQIIVEAAEEYAKAQDERAQAERDLRTLAEEGEGAFERVLDQLRGPRPHICPPGAWGCVSVVARSGGQAVPSELVRAFLGEMSLPAGVAVSAAALAPDQDVWGANVLSRFYDGVTQGSSGIVDGLLGGITRLWGSVLVSYGTAYADVGSSVGGFLDKVDGVFGGTAGAWLRSVVGRVLGASGLEPSDLRLRKPVLASAQDVLGKAGIDPGGKVCQLVALLEEGASVGSVVRALGLGLGEGEPGRELVVAELPIPGTEDTVPLVLDTTMLGEVP